MKKQRVLVCLVSAQALPNFLFIKEFFLPGDQIMLITSRGRMEENASHLKNSLNWSNATISIAPLSEKGVEDEFHLLRGEINEMLPEGVRYIANITGGTKLMSLAMYEHLRSFNDCEMYYMPYPKMVFHQINNKTIQIKTHVTVEDYFSMYGIKYKPSNSGCYETPELAQHFFYIYTTKIQNKEIVDAFEYLRDLRKKKKGLTQDSIPSVKAVLDYFEYEPKMNSKKEIEYLTGGWFEEWTYYEIKQQLKLEDDSIAINPHIFIDKRDNELDVVFMHNNTLQLVECKSGIESRTMLNGILDKLNSIKTLTRSLSAKGALFAIVKDNDNWKKTAQAVGINYLDRGVLVDPDRRFSFIK